MKKYFFVIVLILCLSLIVKYDLAKAQNGSTPQPVMQQVEIAPANSVKKIPQNSPKNQNCPTNICPPLSKPNYNYNNNGANIPPITLNRNNTTPNQQPYRNMPPGQQAPPNSNMNDGPLNVLLVLDSSGSMEEMIGNDMKIDIAKRVIYNTVRQLPPNIRVGLRVYGHKIGFMGIYPCRKTELLVPIGFNTSNIILRKLSNITPTGMTPIAYSIKTAVENDFNGLNGPKRIILVSDGMETCDGDPCSYAVELVRRGIDMKIDVVGFDLKDEEAINQLKCIALSTEGKFYTADTEAALARSLQNSLQVKTNVQGKIILNK